MNTQDKMIGSGGCQLVKPSATLTTLVDAGNECYGIGIRTDLTQIKSVVIAGTGATVNDKSWMNFGLDKGEYIGLRYPISSITVYAATDSVWLYTQPI